jgi:hypothetical protein
LDEERKRLSVWIIQVRRKSRCAPYDARCAASFASSLTSGFPGNMYVRVRLQV